MIGIQKKNFPVSGSFTYLDAGGEQAIFEITASKFSIIKQIIIDTTTLILDGTFKVYSKIDGTNYRELKNDLPFTKATDPAGIIIEANFDYQFSIDTDFKITYTESADEGADRILPYKYILEK